MKKLLGILIIFSSLSMHAAEETYMGIIKEDVTRPFKESYKNFLAYVDRFNRCIQGKCTKREALRAAKDIGKAALGISKAALTVTATIFGINPSSDSPVYLGGKN